jgi:hypothetical protein
MSELIALVSTTLHPGISLSVSFTVVLQECLSGTASDHFPWKRCPGCNKLGSDYSNVFYATAIFGTPAGPGHDRF